MSELKCCPFCGCNNIQFWETDNDTHRFQIVCMQCFNGTDECISEEVAIEKWNTRTPMSNIVEKLEELKKEDVCMETSCTECKEKYKNNSKKDRYEPMQKLVLDKAINIVKQEINNGLE